jgi:hypothetical protein
MHTCAAAAILDRQPAGQNTWNRGLMSGYFSLEAAIAISCMVQQLQYAGNGGKRQKKGSPVHSKTIQCVQTFPSEVVGEGDKNNTMSVYC